MSFAFTTGTRPETAVAFVLVLALGWLCYHGVILSGYVI